MKTIKGPQPRKGYEFIKDVDPGTTVYTEFGTVAKAYIEKPKLTDEQVSTIETLNLFALSQNRSSQFSTPSQTLKKNLRTYLSQFRIIGDNIEIKDAFIINIAVDFEIIVLPNYNNNDVILACINS